MRWIVGFVKLWCTIFCYSVVISSPWSATLNEWSRCSCGARSQINKRAPLCTAGLDSFCRSSFSSLLWLFTLLSASCWLCCDLPEETTACMFVLDLQSFKLLSICFREQKVTPGAADACSICCFYSLGFIACFLFSHCFLFSWRRSRSSYLSFYLTCSLSVSFFVCVCLPRCGTRNIRRGRYDAAYQSWVMVYSV